MADHDCNINNNRKLWILPPFHSYYNYAAKDKPICYFDENRIFHRLTVAEHPDILTDSKLLSDVNKGALRKALLHMENGMHWDNLYSFMEEEINKEKQKHQDRLRARRIDIEKLVLVPYFGLVELPKDQIGYFDENGIYHVCKGTDETIPLINRRLFNTEDGKRYWISDKEYIENKEIDPVNKQDCVLFGKAVRKLKEGDTWETFLSFAQNARYDIGSSQLKMKHQWINANGAENLIGRIERPLFRRNPGNQNTKTFDYIDVIVYLLPQPNMDECIKTHRKDFIQIVNNKIFESKRFHTFGVPQNFLQLTSIRFNQKLNSLRFMYELKQELQNVLEAKSNE